MIYIKKFESTSNYDVDLFNIKDAYKLYMKYYELYNGDYDLKDKIHYFSYDDFNTMYSSEKYIKTCRFIIAYNNKDILGICKFAFFDMSNHYAMSYCSTNKNYLSSGISKRLLEEMFKYFSKKLPNEILHFSGYSIEGWKYLRKYILLYSKKYNVKIKEKGVEYPGKSGYSDEYYNLVNKSKKEIKKLYGEQY